MSGTGESEYESVGEEDDTSQKSDVVIGEDGKSQADDVEVDNEPTEEANEDLIDKAEESKDSETKVEQDLDQVPVSIESTLNENEEISKIDKHDDELDVKVDDKLSSFEADKPVPEEEVQGDKEVVVEQDIEANQSNNIENTEADVEDEEDDDDDYEDIEDSLDSHDGSEHSGSFANKECEVEEDQKNTEEEGDADELGEESEKKVDDDEDKRNPQYIPKRGPFYEHDDRMTEEIAEQQEPEKTPEVSEIPIVIMKKPQQEVEDTKKRHKKKLWDDDDRWGHDMFNEKDQTPKSKDELIEIYGYDIRNEDDAPKAIRRRRYGRGPNKYTRQWQDEDAYTRSKLATERPGRPVRNENVYGIDRKQRVEKKQHLSNRDDRGFQRSPRNNELRDDVKERETKKQFERKRMPPEPLQNKPSQQPFSKDDFPELPSMNKTSPDNDKKSFKYQGSQQEYVYKTEPMKVIEAIENRSNYNDQAEVVRTQTFENSKYSHRKNNFDYDESFRNRRDGRNRTSNETYGRAIRKTNNFVSANTTRESPNDNTYRSRNVRSERNFNDETQKGYIRQYEEEAGHKSEENLPYVELTSGIQKMNLSRGEKLQNKNNENEQPRTKRYSSLRQQRIISDNMPGINNTHLQHQQGSERNQLNQTQFYDAAQIPSATYFQETPPPSVNVNAYNYLPQNAPETTAQAHHQRFLPPQIAQQLPPAGFLPQTASPAEPRFLTSVASAAPTSPPTIPPTVQPVMTAPPPPSAYMSQYTPSGYPQYPPPPPPTHVPPGYHAAIVAAPPPVPAAPPPPPGQQMPEVYRSGVTYYDTSSQQHSPRQVPQRRPKAAIPIVAPPDSSAEGEDKSYVAVNS